MSQPSNALLCAQKPVSYNCERFDKRHQKTFVTTQRNLFRVRKNALALKFVQRYKTKQLRLKVKTTENNIQKRLQTEQDFIVSSHEIETTFSWVSSL